MTVKTLQPRRIAAQAEEIEILLRDQLRSKKFYDRLTSIRVTPSDSHLCGWRADVQGEFSGVESDECRGTVIKLQRQYSLRA
jgi:hypothetical protein